MLRIYEGMLRGGWACMNLLRRWWLAIFIALVCWTVVGLVFWAIMQSVQAEPEPYDMPCRTVGHLEVPCD